MNAMDSLTSQGDVVAVAKDRQDGGPPARFRSASRNRGDRTWNALLYGFGGAILLLAGLILVMLARTSAPVWSKIGFYRFLTGTDWNPVNDAFGALPFIYGTLVTSAVAIVLAVPVALGLALFATQLAPRQLSPVLTVPVELLAAIPSVVYGLWGLFVMVPFLRGAVQPFLQRHLGFLPLFDGPPIGLGYLAAGVILAIMILPTISAVATEVIRTVPGSLAEAAHALGATRWEAIRLAVLPYSRAGILGAVLLGLGRALGETMAVTMVIGNSPTLSASLFAPGYSLPSVIANEFSEATTSMHVGALTGLALILFGLTLLLNASARLLMRATVGKAVRGVA
jgi:phosphate transport system permease protein